MTKRSRIFPLLGALFLVPSLLAAVTVVGKLDLKPVSVRVGRLYPETDQSIRIVVRDERPPDPFVVSGVGDAGFGRRVLQAFYTESPQTVATVFEAAAAESIEILGMKPGEGVVLEISIQQFRVEMASPSFGLPNFISYGRIQTALKSPDGGDLSSGSFPVATWETASKGGEAVAAAHAKAVWEAAARTLLGHFPKKPEPEAIQRVLASLDTNKDERQRDYAVFWLGLVGRETPAVAEKLFALFRKEENQSVSQSAAIALAMLGAPGAREQFEAVLSGASKLSEWDPRDDSEQAWHLLHALALLGSTDLGEKVPPTKRLHEKLTDLVRFQETGEIPRMAQKDLDELTRKLEKKRKK
ncbi:MAG: hypothetical protein ACRD3M_13110 [Thermoanaerobaculia bacterium]